jgi:hypothetical protein
VRRWFESVDLPLLLSQTKYDWSQAAAEAYVDRAKYDMVAKCGVGGQSKSDLLRTNTRLHYRLQVRRWSEPVDLPLLLSQTKYNWSLASVEAHVDDARYDTNAHCGVGGQSKSQIGPPPDAYEATLSFAGEEMV